MKRGRFSEEQIIGILKEAETAGNIRAVCREHNIMEQSFYRWRSKYGGLDVSEARKLRELERENSKLRKKVADLSLDVPERKQVVSLADRRRAAEHLEGAFAVSERRSCRVVEIARSTNRRPSGHPEDSHLVAKLHELSEQYPRFGYRKIHWRSKASRWNVSRERVRLLRRREG
jgi:putative transposase